MPRQKDELVVFTFGELKGQTGKFLGYLEYTRYATILVNGKEVKYDCGDFISQTKMVENYIGFKPLGYIAKDEIIIGFIDQDDKGEYLAVRLDDEGVKLTEPLPWCDRITQAIKTNNDWWADETRDNLDYLYEELIFTGYTPFEIPENYTHNMGIVERLKVEQDLQIFYINRGHTLPRETTIAQQE